MSVASVVTDGAPRTDETSTDDPTVPTQPPHAGRVSGVSTRLSTRIERI